MGTRNCRDISRGVRVSSTSTTVFVYRDGSTLQEWPPQYNGGSCSPTFVTSQWRVDGLINLFFFFLSSQWHSSPANSSTEVTVQWPSERMTDRTPRDRLLYVLVIIAVKRLLRRVSLITEYRKRRKDPEVSTSLSGLYRWGSTSSSVVLGNPT